MAAGKSPREPEAALADIQDHVLKVAAVELQHELDQETVSKLGAKGSPSGKKDGFRTYRIQFDGKEIELRLQRGRLRDGTYAAPELLGLLKDQQRDRVLDLIKSARSLRKAAQLSGGGRGMSAATLGRRSKEEKVRQLDELMTRPLGDMGIVAVMMDGVAIGGKRDKRTVLVAIGIAADGRKVPLAISEDQFETGDQAARLLNGLLDRGLDERVLWITDGGKGMRAGIEEMSQSPPLVQRCTKHKLDNVYKSLQEYKATPETRDRITELIRGAWDSGDPDVALAKLKPVIDELDKRKYTRAANALRPEEGIDETLTVMRLGLPMETVVALRSTNTIESIMDQIREGTGQVKNWHQATPANRMRLYHVASVLMDKESQWDPAVKDASGLLRIQATRLRERPGHFKRSPHLSVEHLAIATDADASRHAARLLNRTNLNAKQRERRAPSQDAAPELGARPRWLGSPEALARAGLDRGADVTAEGLMSALRGRRSGSTTTFRRGTAYLSFRLTVPEEASADVRDRAAADDALLAGAQSALEALAHAGDGTSGQPVRGVAAIGTVHVERAPRERSDGIRRVVEGVVLGVDRGESQLLSPRELPTDRVTRRGAEAAAKAALERAWTAIEPTRATEATGAREKAAEPPAPRERHRQDALAGVDQRPRPARAPEAAAERSNATPTPQPPAPQAEPERSDATPTPQPPAPQAEQRLAAAEAGRAETVAEPAGPGEPPGNAPPAAPAPPAPATTAPPAPAAGPAPVAREDSATRLRRRLGERRGSKIERHADVLAPRLENWDEGSLRAEQWRLLGSLPKLDAEAAYEVRRIEHARESAERTRRELLREAQALRAEARRLGAKAEQFRWPAGRRERSALFRQRDQRHEAAEIATAGAVGAKRRITSLGKGEQAIWREGRHPDQWLAANFDELARLVAVERRLKQIERERTPGDRAGRKLDPEPGRTASGRPAQPPQEPSRVAGPPARDLAGAGIGS